MSRGWVKRSTFCTTLTILTILDGSLRGSTLNHDGTGRWAHTGLGRKHTAMIEIVDAVYGLRNGGAPSACRSNQHCLPLLHHHYHVRSEALHAQRTARCWVWYPSSGRQHTPAHTSTHVHWPVHTEMSPASSRLEILVGCWEFYVLVTSQVISGGVPTCDSAHSW